MFIKTRDRRIINLKDIKSIYLEEINSDLYLIQADDFYDCSYCVYQGTNEENVENIFYEIIGEIENQGLLIEV